MDTFTTVLKSIRPYPVWIQSNVQNKQLTKEKSGLPTRNPDFLNIIKTYQISCLFLPQFRIGYIQTAFIGTRQNAVIEPKTATSSLTYFPTSQPVA